MQPESQNATNGPKSQLEWGQINFLHTTDTHGWLEGHLKEQNYGADWGDYVSFVKGMRRKSKELGVDLLVVDTGDLHDGAGLSDATSPNGAVSNVIFEKLDYDLLTIGNHELYVSEIAYETFSQFSKFYGDRYLTSNVQIYNPSTSAFEYIGQRYRYFKTEHGIRIMSFGVLFDFTGNSNVSKITKGADMVKEQWFLDAVNYHKPIDMFLLIGHNPVRPTGKAGDTGTFATVYSAIRKARPDVPIQGFGGHTHIRDFFVYDNKATALESGRYCETLGWVAIDGLSCGPKSPKDVPHPSREAKIISNITLPHSNTSSSLRYARRYLDWNRLTFAYHASGSQAHTVRPLDTQAGKSVTADITTERTKLNLTSLYGCAPQTWCQTCAPFMSAGNIFSLLSTALSTVVVNSTRATTPRIIIINTGSIRFDLAKGPFTYDDSFIVSPFADAFQFIPDVPYAQAKQVLGILNAGAFQKRSTPAPPERGFETRDFAFQPYILLDGDTCVDPPTTSPSLHKRSGRTIRRSTPSPGYTTTDDFGSDGDDTMHARIPFYAQPNDLQANASFPADGTEPETVDVVFLDFIQSYVIDALNKVGGTYAAADVSYYLPKTFTTNSYLPVFAKQMWQAHVPDCPVGAGIGS
ncbi:hypothetical protein EJ05DRAFT_492528 [Pseudovirgaria hyperparasitica]|uniref:Uncharacterized protein n=1 Tax=Pseudovirgaria hyperparasitica TaxID=470096 RepID=A0A6A6W8R5_9PEZI|nr:uncharacterized protein EJ05DRAFT_492528 [Pseudovirgaria hyperparasitica]KAF2758945.1 hypothetical protein EJ05DRAFT_492528 [Pseudovirgaria hyperparasitica]